MIYEHCKAKINILDNNIEVNLVYRDLQLLTSRFDATKPEDVSPEGKIWCAVVDGLSFSAQSWATGQGCTKKECIKNITEVLESIILDSN